MLLAALHPGAAHRILEAEPSCLEAQAGVLPELRSGDLVFRTGRDLMARIVLSRGEGTRFSHVGLIRRGAAGLEVIHAIPDEEGCRGGVRVEPLTAFATASAARDLGFYRLEALDAEAAARVADRALSQCGKPFDGGFCYQDDREVYCTELVLKALAPERTGHLEAMEPLRVPLVQEPVYPPDHLRRLPGVKLLGPS